jgi:hypothetical protein
MAIEGNLINRLMESSTQTTPVVGMGATLISYSDRAAATVIEVINQNLIKVQRDTSTRIDSLGMTDCQTYEYAPNPKGGVEVYRRNKHGKWVSKYSSQSLVLNRRDTYHDYSF